MTPCFSCPPPQLCHPTPFSDWVFVLPAVDWSTLIEGFARWFFGLAPPPPGAGVRSQQPVVPCAPPSPSLHTRAHAQGKTKTRTTLIYCSGDGSQWSQLEVIELFLFSVFTLIVWFPLYGPKQKIMNQKSLPNSCEHEVTRTLERKVLHNFL